MSANFKSPPFTILYIFPSLAASNKVRTKTPIEVARNVRQAIPKVQKLIAFDVSYANKTPPIGAPKAAATPTPAPAATMILLSLSFQKDLLHGHGI